MISLSSLCEASSLFGFCSELVDGDEWLPVYIGDDGCIESVEDRKGVPDGGDLRYMNGQRRHGRYE